MSLAEIIKFSPRHLYQTDQHYETCQKMAHLRSENIEERQVLTNLYAMKSQFARSVTALNHYIDTNQLPVTELHLSSGMLDFVGHRINKETVIQCPIEQQDEYIDKSHVLLLLAKAFAHRLFRLIPSRRIESNVIVRGWVEVTLKMYESETHQAVLLIYPFAYNLFRQLKFLLHCRKVAIKFEFAGLPYPITKIITQYIAGVPCDKILANAERVANQCHGVELMLRNPKELYTSDEFESGSFVLYKHLVSEGVRIVNTAHGIGQFCPYICYSEFRLLSASQLSFYEKRNSSIEYTLLKPAHKSALGLPHYKLSEGMEPAVILVHQSFAESGMYIEDIEQSRLDVELSKICEKLGVKYFIKMHPNFNPSPIFRKKDKYRGEKIIAWNQLNGFRPIFITINSTVFLEVRGIAPILLYEGSIFDPSVYFGSEYEGATEANLREKIQRLVVPKNWVFSAAMHAGEKVEGS